MMTKMSLIFDLPCPSWAVQSPDTLMFSQTIYVNISPEAIGLVIVLLQEQALAGLTDSYLTLMLFL